MIIPETKKTALLLLKKEISRKGSTTRSAPKPPNNPKTVSPFISYLNQQGTLNILNPLFSDLKYRFTLRHCWRIYQLSNPCSFLASSQIYSVCASVMKHMSTNSFSRVSKKSIWLCHYLISYIHCNVILCS